MFNKIKYLGIAKLEGLRRFVRPFTSIAFFELKCTLLTEKAMIMINIETFCAYVGNDCKLRTELTQNSYVVEHDGCRYDVHVNACGRFIYRIECEGVVTDMPPLKSRKMIANILDSTMCLLFEAVRTGHKGALDLPYKGPKSVLETRYDHWGAILAHEDEQAAIKAAFEAGGAARNEAYKKERKAIIALLGKGAQGRGLFARLVKERGHSYVYTEGRYDRKLKNVVPCSVTVTCRLAQVWANGEDKITIHGQAHRASTDWRYLRLRLYDALDTLGVNTFDYNVKKQGTV